MTAINNLIFSTGNREKFQTARKVLAVAGIELAQSTLDIPEIQSEDGPTIARDKAAKAFALIGHPVVVTDDTWEIPGLNGFPGAYMKSINHWFTVEDFLRLTAPLSDRRIFLTNHLSYTDGHHIKVISNRREGVLLREARGESCLVSLQTVAMNDDNGLSQAEAFSRGVDHHSTERIAIWVSLLDWLEAHPAA